MLLCSLLLLVSQCFFQSFQSIEKGKGVNYCHLILDQVKVMTNNSKRNGGKANGDQDDKNGELVGCSFGNALFLFFQSATSCQLPGDCCDAESGQH